MNRWLMHPYGNTPSRVEAPLLLLTSDDRYFTHSFLVEEVASRFDFVRVQRIEGAGPWPQLERPFETVRGITSFVDEVIGPYDEQKLDALPPGIECQSGLQGRWP
jgi:pimeloyl-ACP methyl ester carboxylesterase